MKLKDTYPQHAGKKVRFLQSHSRVIKVPSSETHPFKYDDTGEDVFMTPYILNNDVWVVEPESPIEEAIERTLGKLKDSEHGNVFYVNKDAVRCEMRRIVNLTLDEVKKAAVGKKEICYRLNAQIEKNIDALKVKL